MTTRGPGLTSTGNRVLLSTVAGLLAWAASGSIALMLLTGLVLYAVLTAIVRRQAGSDSSR